MYMKDKNARITVRLTPEQMAYVLEMAESFKQSPSDIIRLFIDVARYGKDTKK